MFHREASEVDRLTHMVMLQADVIATIEYELATARALVKAQDIVIASQQRQIDRMSYRNQVMSEAYEESKRPRSDMGQ